MHDIAHAAADAARVPPYDEVAARGHRRQQARRGLVVSAAGLAAVTVVGMAQLTGGGSSPEPEPAAPTTGTAVPSGSEPTSIPYWVDGALHVGEVTISTDLRNAVYAGGTTIVGDSDLEGPSEYHLVQGDRLVPVLESEHLTWPELSRDGELVVLVEQRSDRVRRVTAWDVQSRSVVDTVDVPCCEAGFGDLLVVGIDDDHRVFLSDAEQALMWEPGADPVPVTGVDPGSLRAKPWPGGLAHRYEPSPGQVRDAFGTVGDDGVFEEVGTVTGFEFGLWSPSGDVWVGYHLPWGNGTIGVEPAAGGPAQEVDLPGPGWWEPIGWESETQLVMATWGEQTDKSVPPPTEELARCDVRALTCVRIDDVPAGAVEWADGDPGL